MGYMLQVFVSFLKSFLRSSYFTVAMLLGIGIVASFLREILLAYYYGTSEEIEIFRLSVLLPHMLTQTCAPVFMAACLPLLNKYQDQDEGRAERIIFVVNILFSTVLFMAGVIFSGFLAGTLAPGFDVYKQNLLADALRYTWLYFFLASLSLTIRARLLNKEIYWPGTLSSAVIGVIFIFVISLYQVVPFLTEQKNSLSLALVCSGLSVLLVHILSAKKYKLNKISLKRTDLSDRLLTPLIYSVLSAILFKLINFVPRIIDRMVATSMNQGVLACLEYSFGILNIFGILIGTTVSTVIMPRFVKKKSDHGILPAFKSTKSIFIGIVILSVLISIGGAISSESLIMLVFQRGSFDEKAVMMTANIFHWQIFALPLINITLVLSQLIILLGRSRLLMISVLFKILTKFILVYFFVDTLKEGIFGITLFLSEFVFMSVMIIILYKIYYECKP